MKTYVLFLALCTMLIQTELRSQTCSGTQTLTANTGTFSDRASGDVYGDNLDCRWLIQPTGGRRVTLSFTRFSTEQNVDFVTIYDGSTISDRVLGRFSGSSLPSSVTSSGGAILVRFTSDAFVGTTGWTASYVTEAESAINPAQIQWQKVNALGDRGITSFTSRGNTIFVGTSNSGVFRSSDNGETWASVNMGLGSNLSVSALASNNTSIYCIAQGRLFASIDLGSTWTAISTGNVSAIITSSNSVLYASSGNVFRSTDNGVTWTNVLPVLGGRRIIDLSSDNNLRIIASSNDGLYNSIDNGATWQLLFNGGGLWGSVIFVGNDIWGISEIFNPGGFTSRTVVNVYSGTSNNSRVLPLPSAPPRVLFVVNNTNVLLGTGGVYLTINNGTSWTGINNGFNSPFSGAINFTINAFAFNGQRLFAGTTLGLFRSPLSITSSVSQENTNTRNGLSNHPNPSSDFTTIQYTLAQASHVQIELYSLLGTRLATLVQEQQAAGNYVVPVDVRTYPSGQYYYRLGVNGEWVSRSLQVVR